jgi:hypothetical protein
VVIYVNKIQLIKGSKHVICEFEKLSVQKALEYKACLNSGNKSSQRAKLSVENKSTEPIQI